MTDDYGTVGGGDNNQAGDDAGTPFDRAYATVPGGQDNTASGGWSLAAGRRAKAVHDGAFVWADSTNLDFSSRQLNEFSVRATGDPAQPNASAVRFVTAVDAAGAPTAGVQLFPGSAAWAALSDRASKRDFDTVDGREVLTRLAGMPIGTWSYTAQDASIRHIGPMAQDFRAAFGVGEDERHITTIDADGVALAAIQGLYRVVQDKDARIAHLERKNSAQQEQMALLQRENAAVEARLAALERTVALALSSAQSGEMVGSSSGAAPR